MQDLKKVVIDRLNNGQLYKIVFLGDSITSAEWVHPNWRDIVEYVLKFELEGIFKSWEVSHWNIRCISVGLNGGTTEDLLRFLNNEVLGYSPDLVICMGTDNDAMYDILLEKQVENIASIRKVLSEKVEHFVYCPDIASGNEKKNADYQKFVDAVMEVKPKSNEIVINVFEEFKKFDLSKFFTFLLSPEEREDKNVEEVDLVHPNVLGNAYLAKIMLEKVFAISFDPEKYVRDVAKGVKYPKY